MANYRPRLTSLKPLYIVNPVWQVSKGVPVKKYPDFDIDTLDPAKIFNGTFQTFGGTETTADGIISVEDTAVIETWYRTDINADSYIYNIREQKLYEVLNTPEDVNQNHQILRFKVRFIGGKA